MNFKRKPPYFIVRENCNNFAGWIKAGMNTTKYEEDENGFVAENYRVDCKIEEFEDVVKQQTVVTNISNKDIKLKHVSSAYIGGIGEGGLRPWYDDERFLVHYCFSTWQGEGQWRCNTLSDLGLFRASNHSCANVITFSSVGNQTTSARYPLIFIEDCELGKTWFFEIESGTNWYIEIGVDSIKPEGNLYVEMNSAYYNKDGWNKLLKTGESYTSVPAVFGMVDGGLEKAIRVLNDYKRANSVVNNKKLYVCFNDYMNCLWAKPSEKKLIPLIDKAAEVGCEIFCIDDGWFGYDLEMGNLGDWVPNDGKFGEYGFKGIIEYIKKKGMIPGVWLEIDSVSPGTRFAEEYADCLLRINGDIAGSSWRYLLDLRKPKARECILGVFDMLYETGVRFVKNDYNQTSGIGYDGEDSYGEELRKCSESFYGIIDEVMAKFPDFMIENCASGGMRTDGATIPNNKNDLEEMSFLNNEIFDGVKQTTNGGECGWIRQEDITSYRIDANYLLNKIDRKELEKKFSTLVPLKDVCIINNETISIKNDKIYNYLEVPDISENTGVITNVRRILGKCLNQSSFHKFYSGDILFTRINPRKNRIAIAPPINDFGIVSKEVYKLQIKPNPYIDATDQYVLCSILQSSHVKNQVIRLSTGSSSSRARVQEIDLLSDVYIPIPDKKMQKKLSESVFKTSIEIWKCSQRFLKTYEKNQFALGSQVSKDDMRSV